MLLEVAYLTKLVQGKQDDGRENAGIDALGADNVKR